MIISIKNSKHNFRAFLWHAFFLALTTSFMDVDTVLTAMLVKAGGGPFAIGLLTAIMIGGASLMQLVFAGFLSGKMYKKKFLLSGIYLRTFAIAVIAVLFYLSDQIPDVWLLILIFIFIAMFSFSGAFANVSYVDMLGKSILPDRRKKFFTLQQTLNSVGLLVSALVVRELLRYFGYPDNYSLLFLIAALLLSVASGGFWMIREVPSGKKTGKNIRDFLRMIPNEVRQNQNLKYYLLIINIMGLGMSIIPFFILLAKEKFGLSDLTVGNFLLFRVTGMFLISMLIFGFFRKKGYKGILYTGLAFGIILPPMALILSGDLYFYHLVFLLSGVFFSIYKIAISGILVEISNEENRAIYTGIAGAGNILPLVFPLIAGSLISAVGFQAVFIFVAISLIFALPLVSRLNCRF